MLVTHFIEICLLKSRLFFLLFEGDNISVTIETYNECHILEQEGLYAFTNLEMLGAIVIYLHQRIQHPPLLLYRFHIR